MDGVTVKAGWAADRPVPPSPGRAGLALLAAVLSDSPTDARHVVRGFAEAGGDVVALATCTGLWCRSLIRDEATRADLRGVAQRALVMLAAEEADQ